MLIADGKDCAKPSVTEKKASPEKYADEDGKDALEDGVADAHMDGDGTAEIAGDQYRAKDGGSRNDIDEDTDELDDAEIDGQVKRKSELKEGLDYRRRFEKMPDGVEEHEYDGEDAEDAAGPEWLT
ncbi:hypothetical protein GCM10011585_18690 [Edaphobacter dinghuensis]|uniref:Uncharacterized protein n=1 Tax=Edaphobacter dinghuensis TaxID=1560005 RepID=A0A917HDA7_9BACT|nr:hypothetical protein GCM10011585_18690 [Edaphobacter dinghuensis]